MSTDIQPVRHASEGWGLARPEHSGHSLASRLALSYAVSAFLLVAAASGLQYRALVASLAAEDDQLLRERLADVVASADVPVAAPSRGTRVTVAGEMPVRFLDGDCRPIVVTRAHEPLPPPQCPAQATWPPSAGGASHPVLLRTVRGADGDEWRVAVSPRQVGPTASAVDGWVEVLLDRSRDREVLARFRAEAAAVLIGALAVAAGLGYGLARRGLRPLAALRDRVERIDARSLDLRLASADTPTEVAALAASFDAMLARLQGAFAALSARSGELAHELRTPLHVLRQQAEVALRKARTPEEYREVLGSSLEELDRLRRLADDMLFLARAADPRAEIHRTPLSVATEFADVASYLEALAEEHDVHIAVHATPDLTVLADRALLRRALVNLITNALRHTPAGGQVTLSAARLATKSAAQMGVALMVEDTGSGVAAEFQPRAFEPYASSGSSGAGLGLAIVRGIMELHGGTATLTSTQAHGTRVRLEFPEAPPLGGALGPIPQF